MSVHSLLIYATVVFYKSWRYSHGHSHGHSHVHSHEHSHEHSYEHSHVHSHGHSHEHSHNNISQLLIGIFVFMEIISNNSVKFILNMSNFH